MNNITACVLLMAAIVIKVTAQPDTKQGTKPKSEKVETSTRIDNNHKQMVPQKLNTEREILMSPFRV